MTPADMAALHGRCFTTPRPWSAAEIAALQADPFCFCLQRDGGFLIGRVVAGEAELLTLAVAPEARRQGLGRALLTGFLAESARRGAEQAFLEVTAENDPALALYAAGGFAQAGRRRGYYRRADGSALDALVLARAVSADDLRLT
ncbi:alanine acetyltransferase [Gemmobacter lanyuensis]|uniref:Alanine acetyltransferase n=1 Tax=Gemmobacter lanyuensis TaxID=1054497 RepID=A0A918MPV2_9RHOB|nr:GNAT family N-acetyltransferase [Gemmobacter lanyuensis]GGW43983.1 alanine acetyltransferase [Gemmobacter lanyuensis]